MLEYGVGRAGQKSMMNARRTVDPEEARLLNEYSQAARHFAETVDRLQVTEDLRARLSQSVQQTLKLGKDLMFVVLASPNPSEGGAFEDPIF